MSSGLFEKDVTDKLFAYWPYINDRAMYKHTNDRYFYL